MNTIDCSWAVILAAGQSSRLAKSGVTTPKQFLDFDGIPLFWRSARMFSHVPTICGIVFVFPPLSEHEDTDTYSSLIQKLEDSTGVLRVSRRIAFGGEQRQDSVYNALAMLPAECDSVLIHDAARPFATAALSVRILETLQKGAQAVIPAVAVADTIKAVRSLNTGSSGSYGGEEVICTYPRETLRAVQTPQGFSLGILRHAHDLAREKGWEVTDDAALLEQCSVPVTVIMGEEANRKITTLQDLDLLNAKESDVPQRVPCSGLGYDVHRYGGERPFILGGVPIATDITIAAHSDGDTLIHALIDALLGCIGGGDIGGMFPDSDPVYDNIASGVLLAEVLERCFTHKLEITNVDITIVAQVPRLAPHRDNIAANVAKLLHMPRSRVNVKATTEEHLGFTGEKKGIKVMALVSGWLPSL